MNGQLKNQMNLKFTVLKDLLLYLKMGKYLSFAELQKVHSHYHMPINAV